MKFSFSLALLSFAGLSKAQDDSCGVVNANYGTGNAVDDQRGNSAIRVEKGNSASCKVLCDSADNIEFYIGYSVPGALTKQNADGQNTDMQCGGQLQATNDEGDNGFSYIIVASNFVNLRVDCGCPTNDQNGGGCFSATDTVQVLGETQPVPMKNLQIGDRVLTSFQTYEPVYSFGHAHSTIESEFVKIQTSTKQTVTLTPNHLISVSDVTPVRADQVQVGDSLNVVSNDNMSEAKVSKVSFVTKQGMFMPLTPSGKIIVNDIEASAYVSMSDYAPIQEHPLLNFWLSENFLVHLWLAPYRMYCMGIASDQCADHVPKDVDGVDGILPYLKLGKTVAEVALDSNILVQILMGVPVFGALLLIYGLELVTGPALGPLVMLIAISIFVERRRKSAAGGKIKSV